MRSGGYIKFKFDYQQLRDNILSKYIIHSIKGSDYLEQGEDEKFRELCEEDTQYLDVINSSDWIIIDKNGKRIKILCPAFHGNKEITWQKDYGD